MKNPELRKKSHQKRSPGLDVSVFWEVLTFGHSIGKSGTFEE